MAVENGSAALTFSTPVLDKLEPPLEANGLEAIADDGSGSKGAPLFLGLQPSDHVQALFRPR